MKSMRKTILPKIVLKCALLIVGFFFLSNVSHAQTQSSKTNNSSTSRSTTDSVATLGAGGRVYVVPANKAYETKATNQSTGRNGQSPQTSGTSSPANVPASNKPKR